MPFGIFDIALAALAALLGGLAGRQLALRWRLALPFAITIGALSGLAAAMLLGSYFGSVFIGLLVLAIFVFHL